MRIVTDTASLFSPEEGRALGVEVVPACAVIDGQVYRDFEDISSEEFLQKIEEGAVPTTSQPSVGDYMDAFEGEDEVLFLSIGDGLSGGYQNAMGVKSTMEDGSNIHVVDTKTLAGPQHYLVEKALSPFVVQIRLAHGYRIQFLRNQLNLVHKSNSLDIS